MKVAVIGDIMIDRYVYGKSDRVSPEAPVPVVLEGETKDVLGGAGNVYNNLIGLGVDVLLCGAVGNFEDFENTNLIVRNGIFEKGITTIKKRIIANGQQVLRIDREEKCWLSADDINYILHSIADFSPDAIIVSDYNKGVVSRRLVDKLKVFSGLKIADPKVDLDMFAGFDTITPNEKEWNNHSGRMTTDAVLLTCGSKGMKLITDDSRDIKTVAKSVYDVTGAGDTVIATYTYFRLLGYSRYDSANFANIAAGIVVSKAGTSFIQLEDLNEYINPFNNIKVVDKVWGQEIWIANSNLYCGKILKLNQGYKCSTHHHKEKDETFYVLDGKVRMVINDEERIMEKGDTVKLKPNDWHSFGGILPSVILEVSTQHFDEDSYRKNESGKWDEYENYIH